MRFMMICAVVAVLGGCKDEKKTAGGTGAGSDLGGMNMGSNPAGVVPAEGPKLDCTKVVPAPVRDKFFKDHELTDQPKPQAWQGECTIKGKAPTATGIIMASCHAENATPEARTVALGELKKLYADKAKELQGVGLAAMQIGDTQVTAFNETCRIDVNVPAGIDAVAVVKELLPVVTGK